MRDNRPKGYDGGGSMWVKKTGFWSVAIMAIEMSGCASTPPAPTSHVEHTAQGFAAETQTQPVAQTSASEMQKTNLPSAPLNTPLCGAALREQAQTGAGLYTQGMTSGNSCAQNACFQPLTGTFISQNGTNSVCR
ncbi:hypothetical protein [Saccharibacter floricola]|uniref:hypothetical protein n=1 Tax=Saccharibacter floricola TaxID=231053 RepID=UPI0012E9DD70|nr:hypothetical protein [Saccharibacter floricola]